MKALRCAIYTRKSSEEGLEQDFNSLHAQREACEAYVRSQAGEGWSCSKTHYDDGGISGGTLERPALKALLADINAGKVDVVVVYKVDRLTRSLTDFAKIVEVFDKRSVSFVSITQAFNTTSSMGRLTLNVLLSFAQFEREVTGERIRDKIAASKKKGLWMGGLPPLGYDPNGRTLKINEAEASTVRHIFQRYLELGSVHALVDELEAAGIRSKAWNTKTGRAMGGFPLQRGAVYHLLQNPIYRGEIRHRGKVYPGQHPPIIDADTFERVRDALDTATPRRRAAAMTTPPHFPLVGKIFDQDGVLMSPSTTRNRHGKRYRYYVSGAVMRGGRAAQVSGLRRISADALEDLIRRSSPASGDPLRAVERIDITATTIDIRLSGEAPAVQLDLKRFLPGEARVIGDRALPQRRITVQNALRRAHILARQAGLSPHFGSETEKPGALSNPAHRELVTLAFLSPATQKAIFAGRLGELSIDSLLAIAARPWTEQDALLAA